MMMFLFGILAWSAFATIFVLLGDRLGEETVTTVIAGPIGWVFALIVQFFYKVRKLVLNRVDQGMVKDENGTIYHCNPSDWYIIAGYVPGWERCKREEFTGNIMSARFAPRRIWKQYPVVPKSVILAAKEAAKNDVEETEVW